MNQEARIYIRNTDMTSNRVSKMYEAKTDRNKEKQRNPQIINIDTLLSVIEQVKINKYTEDLNDKAFYKCFNIKHYTPKS